jgi:hypothetical protein
MRSDSSYGVVMHGERAMIFGDHKYSLSIICFLPDIALPSLYSGMRRAMVSLRAYKHGR